MRIEHVKINLEKRKSITGLGYALGMPASNEQISCAESKLKVKFPEQVKLFYKMYNGITIDNPHLVVYPLENLVIDNNSIIHFARINHTCELGLDAAKMNEANQWNIITISDGFLITLTFASFWSNKIWAWIDNQRAIWCDEP